MASPDTPRPSRAKGGTRRKQREDVLTRLRALGAWLLRRSPSVPGPLRRLPARLAPLLPPVPGPLRRLAVRLAPLLPPALRHPRRAALAGSGLALVALVVALVLAFTAGGRPASSSASGHASGGKTVSKLLGGDHRALPPGAKASTVGGAAAVARAAGALPLPKRLTAKAIAWRNGRGGALLAAVSREYGSVTQAGGMRQYATMRFNCEELASGVSAAQAGPRIPDPAMQKLYSRALSELATAAANCKAAISQRPDGDESLQTHEDPRLFRLANTELSAGAGDLYRATAEIQAAGRRHH